MTVTAESLIALPPPPPRRVPIEGIRLDSSYQRDLDTTRVQTMLRDWDPRQAGLLTLSHRADSLWCVDGMHRLFVLRERGEQFCYATVYDGLTQMEEADLFVSLQRNRKSLTAWDLFKAEQTARHPDVLDIVRVVHVAGYRLDLASGPNHIAAIGAVRRIHKLGGDALLRLTLTTVARVWPEGRMALAGQILEGLALFYHSFRNEPQYDEGRAVMVLERHAPVRVMQKAQEIASTRMVATSTAVLVGEAIKGFYNSGLKVDRKLGALKRTKRTYQQSRGRSA